MAAVAVTFAMTGHDIFVSRRPGRRTCIDAGSPPQKNRTQVGLSRSESRCQEGGSA
jgi:hypothetical protein